MSKYSRGLAIIAMIVLILVMAAPGFSAAKYNWKLASVLPDTHPVHKALVFFADKVAEKTHGAVKITVYPAGQLGQEQDYIQGAKLGAIELTKVSAALLGQFSNSMQVVSLPFIWRDAKHQHKVLDGKIGKRLFTDLEPQGFVGLAYFDAGFRSMSTREKPVNVPADLKGLKIRVMQSKPLVDTINAFGATAVPMGQGDVYVALQQKVIDGWENNEPTVLTYNMFEVCKYFSYTRHSSIPDVLIMSKMVYDSVPKDIQKALKAAAVETTTYQRKIWADMEDSTVKQLKDKGMIFNEVKRIKDFQAVAAPVYKSYESTIGADLIQQIIKTK
jgi:tripartite ATP-independent transporter DctP family solute receptor